jgi:hypothetical protein
MPVHQSWLLPLGAGSALLLFRWFADSSGSIRIIVVSMVVFMTLAFIVNLVFSVLTPGAQPLSRWLGTGFLLITPALVHAALSQWPLVAGLSILVGVAGCAVLMIEQGYQRLWLWLLAGIVLLWWMQPGVAIPATAAGLIAFWRQRQQVVRLWVVSLSIIAVLAALAMRFGSWLPENLLSWPSGAWLPNLLYVLTVLVHPYLCMALPLLLLISKKTDLGRPAKKMLLSSVLASLLYTAGLPAPQATDLLPAYLLIFLLFFPAWDRVVSYGFYFLKNRLMLLILGSVAVVQIAMNLLMNYLLH